MQALRVDTVKRKLIKCKKKTKTLYKETTHRSSEKHETRLHRSDIVNIIVAVLRLFTAQHIQLEAILLLYDLMQSYKVLWWIEEASHSPERDWKWEWEVCVVLELHPMPVLGMRQVKLMDEEMDCTSDVGGWVNIELNKCYASCPSCSSSFIRFSLFHIFLWKKTSFYLLFFLLTLKMRIKIRWAEAHLKTHLLPLSFLFFPPCSSAHSVSIVSSISASSQSLVTLTVNDPGRHDICAFFLLLNEAHTMRDAGRPVHPLLAPSIPAVPGSSDLNKWLPGFRRVVI